jgi:hypothetical protein
MYSQDQQDDLKKPPFATKFSSRIDTLHTFLFRKLVMTKRIDLEHCL